MNDIGASLEQFIRSLETAKEVSGRIYRNNLPLDCKLPAIVYSLTNHVVSVSLEGHALHEVEFAISAYANQPSLARKIGSRLCAVFRWYHGLMGAHWIRSCRLMGYSEEPDLESNADTQMGVATLNIAVMYGE